MTTFFLCLTAAIAGGAVAWVISKTLFTKNTVSAAEHNKMQQSLAQMQAETGAQKILLQQANSRLSETNAQAATLRTEWLAYSNSLATALAEKTAVADRLAAAQAQLVEAQQQLQEAQQINTTDKATIASLTANNAAVTIMVSEQKLFIENIRADMERQFRLMANNSLDENSRKLGEQQQEKLQSTLQPFREQIEAFRKQVDEKFTAEVADRNTLKGELGKVFELTNTLTGQTNRLTNALTSQAKTQGNYGEDILETILRNAGMMEGEHYEKQYNTTNEAGDRIIPDIVLHCPDGYSLVVDSKVSLVHYLRYCNDSLTPDEEKLLRREIWQSFKNHIDGLSGKQYERIARSADFVLLFAPVESAFIVAAQHDHDIRNYAFRKKVFLVTPSNLLLVVKMIGDLWQKDRVNKEARDMANRAKLLYEKACGFLTTFSEIGASLEKAQVQYNTATRQLKGSGGLVRQGELLQALIGKDTQKMLPVVGGEDVDA